MKSTGRIKEYWIFENEPGSEAFTFFAETKHSALKQYNEEFQKNYKLVSERRAMGRMHLFVVEKEAWLHYDFREIFVCGYGLIGCITDGRVRDDV